MGREEWEEGLAQRRKGAKEAGKLLQRFRRFSGLEKRVIGWKSIRTADGH